MPAVRLWPIPELDEEDLFATDTSSSASARSNSSLTDSSDVYTPEKPRLTFVRRVVAQPMNDYYTKRYPGGTFLTEPSSDPPLSRTNNAPTVTKKTIYQLEKEKLQTKPSVVKPSSHFTLRNYPTPMVSIPANIVHPNSAPDTSVESRAVYLPYGSKPSHELRAKLASVPSFSVPAEGCLAQATPYEYLGSEEATVLKIFIAPSPAAKRQPSVPMDSQEQVIIASPKPDEASEDSGLENTTPEVSPPGDPQSRTTWRHDSVSSDRSFSSDDKSSDSPIKEEFTEVTMKTRYLSSDKRSSLETSPPISEDEASLRSTLVHGTHVRDTYLHHDKHRAHDLRPTQLERSATANFMCRKDHNEAALCKAIVSQAALEEAKGTFRPAPLRTKSGKYNSVRIEIEANRENHARVAAVKTIHTSQKQTAQASIFKPMCELIEEDLQRRRALYTGAGSISPASSSKSSEFSADNGSLDRMSFGSGHMSDYKVVALDAKPEPGKLTEFVPEVERHKRVHREEPEYVISTVSHSAHFESSPNDTAIVVRNWDLSDEERLVTKSGNNNDDDKASEKSYEPPQHHHRHHHHHNHHHEQEVKFEQPSLPVLGKSADLEFSPDIPTVVLPKKKDRKNRSKSVNSNKSSRSIKSLLSHKSHKSAKSTKSDSSQESFKSAASKAPEPLRSKNPTHSDTDSVPSPEPVTHIKTKHAVESDDEELQVTLNSRATEVEELNDTSSSEGDQRIKTHHHHHHKKIVTSETIIKGDDSDLEETLHYAESKVHIHDDDEKQYANVNNDTLRSSATESTIAESMRHSAADRVTPIERRDTREYHVYSPNREPLFYDTVARYGFDTSGGYHAPKHLYRREIPIYVEEPRHTPKDLPFHMNGPVYSPNNQSEEPYIVAKEDETKISRTTYRFYDRNMQELSRNTMVNEARRVTRSYEDGIDQPIEELESAYYPYAGSADRKWVRNQGYPKPFEPSSKNYVDADSKFRIVPKENSHRPHFTKVQHKKKDTPTPEPTVDEALQVYEDARHPSGAPQHRPDPFSEEALELREKQSKGVLTVSGKLRCAHCGMELGRGSAMIIEALGLFYHINCFRCHVCDKSLGSGTHTTDVRVRDGKLHCEKCYSNEDIGVRLSEI
uniref:LIM zinc-binding domain-containing protein n=1 Tax=Panagrellus redivivus TaxID=6233 RepID=A0A7E4ZQN1_PANRE